MDKESFCNAIMDQLNSHYRNSGKFKIQVTSKNNGVSRIGITIEERNNCNPIVYVDTLYDDYEKGRDIESIVKMVADTFKNIKINKLGYKPEVIENWEAARQMLDLRIISIAKNERLLENIIWIEHLDLAVYPIIKIDNSNGYESSLKLPKQFTELWGVSEEEIIKNALYNLRSKNQYIIRDLFDMLRKHYSLDQIEAFEQMQEEIPTQYVLSNTEYFYGSAAILDDFFMKDVYERIGSPFYILPSSIHECIAVEVKERKLDDLAYMVNLVKEINNNYLDKEEILSYSVYLYDGNELSIAKKGEWS